jgi:hypothetical protein
MNTTNGMNVIRPLRPNRIHPVHIGNKHYNNAVDVDMTDDGHYVKRLKIDSTTMELVVTKECSEAELSGVHLMK